MNSKARQMNYLVDGFSHWLNGLRLDELQDRRRGFTATGVAYDIQKQVL